MGIGFAEEAGVTDSVITVRNVSKSYEEDSEVLREISLEIRDHELLVLLGESGSGKTTLLKMLNRLIDPSGGEILMDGKNIRSLDAVQLRRTMGYVVQQTGLFPHMTVRENIELVSRIKGEKPAALRERTEAVLRMVGLAPENYMDRYPRELSGGQAQRVGVARAYATNPEIILMDEPFSALDPITRNELQRELLELQQKNPKTIVFVTHDISEAIRLADRIVLLNRGQIEQIGTPRELLVNPRSGYVSRFLGEKRLWKTPWLLRCSDLMSEDVTAIPSDAPVEKAWELMRKDGVSALFVTDGEGRVIGKITEKSMMRRMDAKAVPDLMLSSFDCMEQDAPLREAVGRMYAKNVRHLPVVDGDRRLKGQIRMTDLARVLDENILSEQR